MAFHFTLDGGPRFHPWDVKASRVKPHEFSKMIALAAEDFRCPKCGATADHTTIHDGYALCHAGHRTDLAEVFNATHARVMAANKRLGNGRGS